MSLVLVVGGALLVRSLSAAARVNLGYDADRTAYMSLALEMTGYDAARAPADSSRTACSDSARCRRCKRSR